MREIFINFFFLGCQEPRIFHIPFCVASYAFPYLPFFLSSDAAGHLLPSPGSAQIAAPEIQRGIKSDTLGDVLLGIMLSSCRI